MRPAHTLLFWTGVSALVLALGAPALARGATELRSPSVAAYPLVEVTAVTDAPRTAAPALRENGRPVSGLVAENLGRRKSVVVAVDRSRSMAGRPLVDALAAAREFVASKGPEDRVAVVAFGSRALQLSQFTGSTIDADVALRTLALDAKQGTALYDAVVVAARALAPERNGGRVIVVLTDGRDVSSAATVDEAITAAREAGASVHAIGIEGDQFSPAELRALADATGGSFRAASSSATLTGAYAEVAAELRRTWRLRYYTAARPGEKLRLDAGGPPVAVAAPGRRQAPERPSELVPAEVYTSSASPLAVAGAVGVLALVAALAVGRVHRGTWLRSRLAPHVEGTRRERRAAAQERFPAGSALLRATESTFGHLRFWRRTQALLARADLPLRTVEFVYLALGAAFGFGLLAAVAAQSTVVVLAAMAAGGAGPYGYLVLRANKRRKAFDNQLPDLLLTLAAALKAGHSFKQGLQTVVDEGEPPASMEFKRVLTEAQLGRPIDQALVEMAERVRSKNLDFVITSVTIQTQVGGSLAGLFDLVAEAVRQRQQFARKIRGLTAMGRASAYVLIGLPFFIAAALTLLNPEYMSPLYDTSTGHTMIGAGLAMMTVGWLILRKVVSFKG